MPAAQQRTPNVWVVRADGGRYTDLWVREGYAAIGWNEIGDLTQLDGPADLDHALSVVYEYTNNLVLRNDASQVRRFGFEMQAGDWVITPAKKRRWLYYGEISADPSYHYFDGSDGCRYSHRRKVRWQNQPLDRWALASDLQKNMRSRITVFAIANRDEFIRTINQPGSAQQGPAKKWASPSAAQRVVLDRVLELDPTEFEFLVGDLMTAIGYEDVEVTGRSGDGGVDVKGVLSGSSLARIDVFVQAKRYQANRKVNASAIQQIRGGLPMNGRGAVVATCGFSRPARDAATAEGFQPVELVDGGQLADLLVEHWAAISGDLRERLGLKPGLVPA